MIGIIGAGPVGLYAAYRLVVAGHEVQIWERGSVAANVKSWGHVKLFSDLGLNLRGDARSALERGCGDAGPRSLPSDGAYLDGAEFARGALEPLAAWLRASGRCAIHERARVVKIGRGRLLKKAFARAGAPFRILLEDGSGERFVAADTVVDCSGTYGAATAARSGSGGVPAIGEAAAEAAGLILREVPAAGANLGARVAVLGGGYSAITALKALADDPSPAAPRQLVWLLRSPDGPPYARVDGDPLPARDRLAAYGNGLAGAAGAPLAGGGSLKCVRGAEVERAAESKDGGLVLTLADGRALTVDRLVSLVGYTPDASLYSELHVHQCYASDGPMKLAATLLGAAGGDCLAQAAPGAATLENPEPDFHILGFKSYGRNSAFLMRVGYEQVDLLCEKLGPGPGAPFSPPPPRGASGGDDPLRGASPAAPVAA